MRLILNMYGVPLALVVAGYLLLDASDRFDGNKYLGGASTLLLNAGAACAVVALIWAIASTWRVWRAYQGKGDLCDRCGYPTRHILNGRYGPYFKCWNCGGNRADS